MTQDDFVTAISNHACRMVDLLRQKNADYAGTDPLKCFRKRGLLGLLVRIEDKLNRYDTFIERGASAEEWAELLSDLVGYGLCGLVMVDEGIANGVG